MITHFVEVTDGMMYGKFMVCRLDATELKTTTAMPEAPEGQRLLTYSGRRRFNDHTTLVIDLQRGTGFAWPLENGVIGMQHYIREHYDKDVGPKLAWLVCPMYLPFVLWLHEQGKWRNGRGFIQEIPRYLDLRTAEVS